MMLYRILYRVYSVELYPVWAERIKSEPKRKGGKRYAKEEFLKVRELQFVSDWLWEARGVSVNSLPRHYDRSVGFLAGGKLMLKRVQVCKKRGYLRNWKSRENRQVIP